MVAVSHLVCIHVQQPSVSQHCMNKQEILHNPVFYPHKYLFNRSLLLSCISNINFAYPSGFFWPVMREYRCGYCQFWVLMKGHCSCGKSFCTSSSYTVPSKILHLAVATAALCCVRLMEWVRRIWLCNFCKYAALECAHYFTGSEWLIID